MDKAHAEWKPPLAETGNEKWQISSEVFSTRDQTRDLEVLYSRAVQRKLHYRELDGALSQWSQMWCIRKYERSGV